MLKATLFLAFLLILAGPALAQETDPAAREANSSEAETLNEDPVDIWDEALNEAPGEAVDETAPEDGSKLIGIPGLQGALEDPVDRRLVQTELLKGWNDRFSLLDLAEASRAWIQSRSAFARTNTTLMAGGEDLADLNIAGQYSLVAYGPRDGGKDQWFVAIRHRHNNQNLNYDFIFAPEGDKMALTEVIENGASLKGGKLRSFLTEVFKQAEKVQKTTPAEE